MRINLCGYHHFMLLNNLKKTTLKMTNLFGRLVFWKKKTQVEQMHSKRRTELSAKKQAELEIARAAFTPDPNAPRKADNSGIEGPARGRDGLIFDLANEMIPYTPEELIRLGEREFAWTVAEMEKAATQMGLGTDWSAAVERVKNMYVEPGRQPEYVRDLLFEAVTYLRNNDVERYRAINAKLGLRR